MPPAWQELHLSNGLLDCTSGLVRERCDSFGRRAALSFYVFDSLRHLRELLHHGIRRRLPIRDLLCDIDFDAFDVTQRMAHLVVLLWCQNTARTYRFVAQAAKLAYGSLGR